MRHLVGKKGEFGSQNEENWLGKEKLGWIMWKIGSKMGKLVPKKGNWLQKRKNGWKMRKLVGIKGEFCWRKGKFIGR